ncbi:MAG TPA: hypothetical protein VMH92_10725 [Acidocella sp.]|nr:hypothetical protein [Acidocella sp.]
MNGRSAQADAYGGAASDQIEALQPPYNPRGTNSRAATQLSWPGPVVRV